MIKIHAVSLLILISLLTCLAPASAAEACLPAQVEKPGHLEKLPSPAGDQTIFYLFQPPAQGRIGVAGAKGEILWEKKTGYRAILDYFWSADGQQVVLVTDCAQPEAELRSPIASTASYLFVLEAASGKIVAQGNLDTDILDLPKQCPDAVGASHLIKIELEDGVLKVSIDHRGQTFAGSRPLAELPAVPKQP